MTPAEKIDFDALTDTQREVLGQIACNNDLGHSRMTLASLVKRGLIEGSKQVIRIRGQFPLAVMRYEMPTWAHIQWCEWCAANHKEESEK